MLFFINLCTIESPWIFFVKVYENQTKTFDQIFRFLSVFFFYLANSNIACDWIFINILRCLFIYSSSFIEIELLYLTRNVLFLKHFL